MDSKRPLPKKNKQQKHDESAWTPGIGSGKPSNGNILYVRCDKSEGVTFSFMLDTDEVQQSHLESVEDFAAAMTLHMQNVSSYRPTHTVINYSINGSPLAVTTPNGRALYRDAQYGAFTIFSDREQAKAAYEASAQFAQLEAFKNVIEVKRQMIELNKEQQQKLQIERKKRGKKRQKSQRKVMGESAESHMERVGAVIEKVKFEWLHLIAHGIAGTMTQNKDNLIAATSHANTDMIFAENELALLCKRYPEGVKLEVIAYLATDNEITDDIHAASKIEYKISTPDFQQTFKFDGNNDVIPHISFKNYVHALIKTLIPDSEPTPLKKKIDADNLPIVSTQSFYKKSKRSLFDKKSDQNNDDNIGPTKKLK